MLSICGSIYHNPNIEILVRSTLDRASNPDDIEFVTVDDESGSEVMARAFDKIRTMTPRFRVLERPKSERIAYFEKCIAFYERETIFPPRVLLDLRKRLTHYAASNTVRIWFPPTAPNNRAVKATTGDVVLVTPMDLATEFDLYEAYERFKERLAGRKHFISLFGVAGHNEIQMHGIKMFDRGLFEETEELDPRWSDSPFAFDERWFVISRHEDDWNERAQVAAGMRHAIGWSVLFGDKPLFRMTKPEPYIPDYLCSDMGRDFRYFDALIKEYLKVARASTKWRVL